MSGNSYFMEDINMTNIHKTIKCIPFMVMLAALSGIVLLGFPTPVSAQRQAVPYYPRGGGSYQPYYPHRGGGYGGGGHWGGGGYSSYRGGGHGLWWVPVAIVGGAVALVANSVALVSNTVTVMSNYNSPHYAPYYEPNYVAPPVYVQPAPSVPPGSFVYPR